MKRMRPAKVNFQVSYNININIEVLFTVEMFLVSSTHIRRGDVRVKIPYYIEASRKIQKFWISTCRQARERSPAVFVQLRAFIPPFVLRHPERSWYPRVHIYC